MFYYVMFFVVIVLPMLIELWVFYAGIWWLATVLRTRATVSKQNGLYGGGIPPRDVVAPSLRGH